MKRLIHITVLALISMLFFLNSSGNQSQSIQLFEKANDYYNQGEFQLAIDAYESILERGEHSTEIYFNLANAYYKINNIPSSIYNYEKALILNPNDTEVINNFNFAKKMTIDEITITPEVGFTKIYHNLVNTFSFDTWSKIAVTGVIVFVILFILYYFAQSTNFKRLSFVSSFVGVVIALFSLFMAFQKNSVDNKYSQAIIFAKAIDIKSEPNIDGSTLFRLHEGTKVKILDNLSGWNYIEIADGLKGWIPANNLKVL